MPSQTERRFDRGQLILAPFKGRNVLWTVTSVGRTGKAKLTAHFGSYVMDITTTVAVLPDDWTIVSQEVAVENVASRVALMDVAATMASTMSDVLNILDNLPDYPWQSGALKNQMREDVTSYELLGLDAEVPDAA